MDNDANFFRHHVGREKNERSTALKRIAADASKLKRKVEEDQYKLDAERRIRMCGDFTSLVGENLPVYSAFETHGEFEHNDDGFNSVNFESAQRKYRHGPPHYSAIISLA